MAAAAPRGGVGGAPDADRGGGVLRPGARVHVGDLPVLVLLRGVRGGGLRQGSVGRARGDPVLAGSPVRQVQDGYGCSAAVRCRGRRLRRLRRASLGIVGGGGRVMMRSSMQNENGGGMLFT